MKPSSSKAMALSFCSDEVEQVKIKQKVGVLKDQCELCEIGKAEHTVHVCTGCVIGTHGLLSGQANQVNSCKQM